MKRAKPIAFSGDNEIIQLLDRVAAVKGAILGKPVTRSALLRSLIRDAASKLGNKELVQG